MPTLAALLCGLVFGTGLIVSGMVDPAKVLSFLDVAGSWNPSLALVMAGAIAVGLTPFAVAKRRTRSWLGLDMKLPTARRIDRRLIGGSVLFGVGWGIAGFCPGPALVAAGMGEAKAVVFVASMLAGMALFEWMERRPARRTPSDGTASETLGNAMAPCRRSLDGDQRMHPGTPENDGHAMQGDMP